MHVPDDWQIWSNGTSGQSPAVPESRLEYDEHVDAGLRHRCETPNSTWAAGLFPAIASGSL